MQVLKKAPTQNPADQTQHKSHTSISQDLAFAIQGNQGFAQDTAMITARRKSTEWSALEKPVAPLPSSLPAGSSFPGAGEGI
jgi:hypothetical protein